MTSPTFSIVIPLFNRKSLINETLASVAMQPEGLFECIIVDDGSTDGSQAVVQQLIKDLPYFGFIQRPDNEQKGAPSCRNIGFKSARGKYVLFLDSDDLLAKDGLSKIAAVIGQQPEYDAYVFQTGIIDAEQKATGFVWNLIHSDDAVLVRFLREDPPWGTTAVCWSKSTIEKLNGFDPEPLCNQDWELAIRAILSGVKFWKAEDHSDFITSYHRVGHGDEHNITAKVLLPRFIESRFELYRKIAAQVENSAYYGQEVSDEIRLLFLRLYHHCMITSNYKMAKAVLEYLHKNGYMPLLERLVLSYNLRLKECKLDHLRILRIPIRLGNHFVAKRRITNRPYILKKAILPI